MRPPLKIILLVVAIALAFLFLSSFTGFFTANGSSWEGKTAVTVDSAQQTITQHIVFGNSKPASCADGIFVETSAGQSIPFSTTDEVYNSDSLCTETDVIFDNIIYKEQPSFGITGASAAQSITYNIYYGKIAAVEAIAPQAEPKVEEQPGFQTQTDISGCYPISSSGFYRLTQNVTNSGADTCMYITANNVILDCQGYTVDGTDGGVGKYGISNMQQISTLGLRSSGTGVSGNITVKNCIITDWEKGIYFSNKGNSSIINNTATSNVIGIDVEIADGGMPTYFNITNNTANSNTDTGIKLLAAYNNLLQNNTAKSNSNNGVYLLASSNNILANNTAESNTIWDFNSSTNSLGNTVTNLEIGSTIVSFTGKDVAVRNGTSPGADPSGYKNISKYVNATNNSADSWLYLNVSYNENELSSGVESTLQMARHNGSWEINASAFTDGVNYGVNTAQNYVYANITNFGSIFAPLSATISDCANIMSSGTYVLNQSIMRPNATCINIAASNVTLDCAGYSMTYTIGGSSTSALNAGVYTSRSNTTIKNCRIYGYFHGIYVADVPYNTLTNNTVSNNTNGIMLFTSTTSANYNNLTGNTVCNNSYGIYLQQSAHNTFTNNTAQNNTNWDFQSITESINNTVTNLATQQSVVSFTSKDISLKGLTPAQGISGYPSGDTNISKWLNATNNSVNSWLFLNVSYTDADVIGVVEDTLSMYRYNGTWETHAFRFANQSGRDTTANYVYANVTNFSTFAPLGQADTVGPTITFVSPTPADNTSTNQNSVSINASVADMLSNIDTCILNFDDVNESMAKIGFGAAVTCNKTKTGLSDGSYTYKIFANESAGNMNVSETRNLQIDTAAPQISSISITNITTSSAIVNWLTDENANSSVNYGTNLSLGNIQSNSSLDKTHNISITGLSAGTTYYYNITSCDTYGNCNTTGTYNFTTSATAVPPTVPPAGQEGGETLLETGVVPAGTYLDAVLGLGDSMTYMSEGVTHTIRVSGFFDDVVELEIQSPVKIKETLKVGETKLFDLNENGLVDLELKLLSKVNDTIKLRIKPLFEVALPPPAPAIVPGAPPTPAAVSVCGNNVCEAGESSANCITDCPMSYTAAFFAGTGSLTNFIIVLLVAVLIYVGWRELEHGHIKLKRKPKPKPRPLCPTSRREKEEDTWKH